MLTRPDKNHDICEIQKINNINGQYTLIELCSGMLQNDQSESVYLIWMSEGSDTHWAKGLIETSTGDIQI